MSLARRWDQVDDGFAWTGDAASEAEGQGVAGYRGQPLTLC